MAKPKNDRNQAVTKFCLAMEEHRRTEAGRVRTAKELVNVFFAHDEKSAKDLLFVHMPNDVRGPILSRWGIRGAKAALRDDSERVRDVVHDALLAGDIDENVFEEGVTAQTLVDWIALSDWWTFWRNGKLTGIAIQKALATARELGLIDDRWFLQNVQGRGGRLRGTDVLCDTLSKDQIVAWIRRLHESGDGSPAGIVAAIGWDTVLAKTAQDALLFALDAFARKAGLAPEVAVADKPEETGSRPRDLAVTTPPQRDAAGSMPVSEGAVPSHPHEDGGPLTPVAAESGLDVAIPDIPIIDASAPEDPDEDQVDIASPTPSAVPQRTSESPKLAEARAAMMAMLDKAQGGERTEWDSDAPAKPSSLEWPEPPPVLVNPPLVNPPLVNPPLVNPPAPAIRGSAQPGTQKDEKGKVNAGPNPPPVPKKTGAPKTQ